jgi:hypothetical protein
MDMLGTHGVQHNHVRGYEHDGMMGTGQSHGGDN